jgi:hypothetical protein
MLLSSCCVGFRPKSHIWWRKVPHPPVCFILVVWYAHQINATAESNVNDSVESRDSYIYTVTVRMGRATTKAAKYFAIHSAAKIVNFSRYLQDKSSLADACRSDFSVFDISQNTGLLYLLLLLNVTATKAPGVDTKEMGGRGGVKKTQ